MFLECSWNVLGMFYKIKCNDLLLGQNVFISSFYMEELEPNALDNFFITTAPRDGKTSAKNIAEAFNAFYLDEFNQIMESDYYSNNNTNDAMVSINLLLPRTGLNGENVKKMLRSNESSDAFIFTEEDAEHFVKLMISSIAMFWYNKRIRIDNAVVSFEEWKNQLIQTFNILFEIVPEVPLFSRRFRRRGGKKKRTQKKIKKSVRRYRKNKARQTRKS